LNFKEYQEKALKTKGKYNDSLDQMINGVMGLNGEAGEVIDMVKKYMYQGHGLSKEEVIDELGDTLWYINLIANSINMSLEDIAKYNIDKLQKRYPKGCFRIEDSVNRKK
jgi:NTP pyrophosphatase (non-canonical NTP hydrolase)